MLFFVFVLSLQHGASGGAEVLGAVVREMWQDGRQLYPPAGSG